mmetsp:Transcript_100423/g.161918  ORF Transcript_100423/g.161918 Transcript_100423/m.161918 type:complete len:181 (-) Transcript_100423:20-562(-)
MYMVYMIKVAVDSLPYGCAGNIPYECEGNRIRACRAPGYIMRDTHALLTMSRRSSSCVTNYISVSTLLVMCHQLYMRMAMELEADISVCLSTWSWAPEQEVCECGERGAARSVTVSTRTIKSVQRLAQSPVSPSLSPSVTQQAQSASEAQQPPAAVCQLPGEAECMVHGLVASVASVLCM